MIGYKFKVNNVIVNLTQLKKNVSTPTYVITKIDNDNADYYIKPSNIKSTYKAQKYYVEKNMMLLSKVKKKYPELLV